jgi:hypothetical protein
MFSIKQGADSVSYQSEVPAPTSIKSAKVLLILKARNSSDKSAPSLDDQNVVKEVIMMELNKNIL